MNRLSAMALRSSLPKRTEKPFAAAYCSAAIAASMLATSACCRCDTAGCPFDGFGVPSPLVCPFTGGVSEGGWSSESLALFTCHSMKRRLPSFRSALQMVNGSRGWMARFYQLRSDHRRNIHYAFVGQVYMI